MALLKKASDLFRSSSRAKSDYTPEELAKAEAYLEEEGYVFSSSYSSETVHLFVKKEDDMETVDIYLKGSGSINKGTMLIFNVCEGGGACQTMPTIHDYVKRKDIEAEKNPVKKLLKMII